MPKLVADYKQDSRKIELYGPQFSYFDQMYFPDKDESDHGATGNGLSVKRIVDKIGTSKNATIVFTHTGTSDTTTYTFTTDETIPSNIRVVMQPGAIIDGAGTLTISGPFEAGPYQVFGSSITVSFGSGAVKEVYPEWWGIDGTADDIQIEAAYDAVGANAPVILQPKTYTLSAGLTWDTNGSAVRCLGGLATLSTSTDIDIVTIQCKNSTFENIKTLRSNGTPTKAGFKLDDGTLNAHIVNCKSFGSAYGMELYSSSGTGTGYNQIYHFHTNDCITADVYIHTSGAGWVNENLFEGGNLHADSTTGRCINIASSSNQNKFFGVSFEGGDEYKFQVVDHGTNIFMGCRFEVNGHGMYVHNPSANFQTMTVLKNNYWGMTTGKVKVTCVDGRLRTDTWHDRMTYEGFVVDATPLDTTVDVDSNSGQKVLSVASTTNCYQGQHVGINVGGEREEWGVIDSVAAGVSITLKANLRYTHTAVQADTVKTYGAIYGNGFYTEDDSANYSAIFVRGVKVARFKNDGTLELDATVSENAW